MENQHELIVGNPTEIKSAIPPQATPPISEAVQVSYATHANHNNVVQKPLSWILGEIRSSSTLKDQVLQIRAEGDPKKRKELKEALLPYFMFMNYKDGKRDVDHFMSTKFILLDVDHVRERMEQLCQAFRTDHRIFLFFRSPSGDGLKVVFALSQYITNSEVYTNTYFHFQHLMKIWYRIESDASTIDSARCCFLSHDPDVYVNWNPTRFDIPAQKTEATSNLAERNSGEKKILSMLQGVPAGGAGQPGRHAALVTLASFYKSKNMDLTATLATLQGWNRLNEPPLEDEVLDKTVEYVFRKPNYGNKGNAKTTDAEELPEEKKVRKMWIGEELKNEAQSAPISELLEGVLADEGVYMFAGQDKAGKSIFGMNLALSIAGDRDTFLTWKIKKHGPVVYFNNELSVKQMGRRLLQMDTPTRVSKDYGVYYMNDKNLRFDENIDEVLEFCTTYSPVLVIVDCHYRTTAQDKDYGNAIQQVLENYTRIKEEMMCCVLIIHHTRKSAVGQRADSSQAMGSHTLAMMTDGNFQLKRSDTEPEKRILFETGSRDFSGFKPRLLQLNELNLWFRDLGECNEEDHTREINRMKKSNIEYPVKVLEDMSNNQMMKDALLGAIMSRYNISKATAYRSIDKATHEGKIAESERHVVTLVKTQAVQEPISVEVPEVGIDEAPDYDLFEADGLEGS
jgi:hypothetical protein